VVQVGSQKYISISFYIFNSQIWLYQLMANHHLSYITQLRKPKKKKEKKKTTVPNQYTLKIFLSSCTITFLLLKFWNIQIGDAGSSFYDN
jgi:hypothetical protein